MWHSYPRHSHLAWGQWLFSQAVVFQAGPLMEGFLGLPTTILHTLLDPFSFLFFLFGFYWITLNQLPEHWNLP
jgi:hypothetical protein